MFKLTNLGGVIGCTKDELRGAIVARADVRHIGLVRDQDFGTPEITKLKNPSIWIEQEILRLDIAMADSLGVDVRKGTEQLVDVYLDLEDRHCRLHLVEEA